MMCEKQPGCSAGIRPHGGADGFISFECTPDLADDTEATIAQARDLWERLDQSNVMIKVPGTSAGVPAIEELTRQGVNINVTLLFSIERYEQVIDAYLRGLMARADQSGAPLDSVRSVASFFLSRIDAKVDERLPEGSPLRGRAPPPRALPIGGTWRSSPVRSGSGSRIWAPSATLWASTATKKPSYSQEVPYVSELIGPDVVNTMPEHTLGAFADHGEIKPTQKRTRPALNAGRCCRRNRSRQRHGQTTSAKASSRSATPTTSCSTSSRASSACSRRHRSLAVRAVSDRLAAFGEDRGVVVLSVARAVEDGRRTLGRSRAHSSFSLSAWPASSSRQRARNYSQTAPAQRARFEPDQIVSLRELRQRLSRWLHVVPDG